MAAAPALVPATRRRSAPGMALVVGLLAAVLTLAGCYGPPDPHVYDDVDATAAAVGVASIGRVDYEGRYGTGRFSDSAPSLIYVLSGDGVQQRLEDSLRDAGFSSVGPDHSIPSAPETWSRPESGKGWQPNVTLMVVPAGSTFQDAEQKQRTVQIESVQVFIS